MIHFIQRIAVLVLFAHLLFAGNIAAKTYYISPDGKDVHPGTMKQPFATIMRAQEAAQPGDTVLIRGGKYLMSESQIAHRQNIFAYVHNITKSGLSEDKRIHYWAYPGERPVFDMSQVKPENHRVIVFYVKGSWLHFKGFDVVGTQVTIKAHTQSECFRIDGGNHNIYEQINMYDGQAIGLYLYRGSHNLILNCDAYNNWDSISTNRKGGNVDGFGAHPTKGSVGNVFRGCRAWFNSDDGYDFIRAYESVLIENCWAMYNGYSSDFASLADGNGFKIGGWGSTPAERVPEHVPMHTVQHCLAVKNKANGFYANHQVESGSYWYNNTAFQNLNNYNMLNRLRDNVTDVPGTNHVLKNNISYSPRNSHIVKVDLENCDATHNTFTIPMKLTANDFQSLNMSELIAPRKSDGSLPDVKFLRPKANSQLIDTGVDIGLPYKGNAPDLGAFE